MHARLLALAITVILTGCASNPVMLGHDHRDRSYDPCYKCGETLFDQTRVGR